MTEWNITLPMTAAGIGKKLVATDRSSWQWQGQSKYTISQGYHWLLGEKEYKKWSKTIWARPILPRHSSKAWFLIKLPVKSRLAKYMGQSFDMSCGLCGIEQEDIDHLFFRCTWATDLWMLAKTWWPTTIVTTDIDSMIQQLQKLKGPRSIRQITYAVMAVSYTHLTLPTKRIV